MHTTSFAHVTRKASRASDSQGVRALARAGLTARGVIYILIGWIALLVAFGQSTREADQQGALQLLASKPCSRPSPCRSWSRFPACTGASATRPTSLAACCSPCSG